MDSMVRIAKARKLMRLCVEKCAEQGVTVEELAIASSYAAFDVAESFVGSGQVAVEWSRTSLDEIERKLLDGGGRTADGFPE